MKSPLAFTAVLESVTGVALLVAPLAVVSLLLGVTLDTPAPIALARIAGAALLALGVACWAASGVAGSRAARGVVWAMLMYNVAVVAVLALGAIVDGLKGLGLWPAVVLHVALAVWCIASMNTRRARTGGFSHRSAR